MGVYNDTAGPGIALQLPEVVALVGDGGTVLLYFELSFAKDEDPDSCKGGCLPAEWQVSAVRQAYALNLRVLILRYYGSNGARHPPPIVRDS